MIKSKFRLASIVIFFLITFGLGLLPYEQFLIKKSFELDTLFFTSSFVLIMLIIGTIYLLRRTLFVKYDERKNVIAFYYVFRFRRYLYQIDEIEGFRFLYIRGRVNFKGLEIKMKNGKTHAITDYATKNLREFEKLFLEKFDLRTGKEFRTLTIKGKNREIKVNKKFDQNQANDTKMWLYLTIGICLVYLVIMIFYNTSLSKGFIALTSFFTLIILVSVKRLMKINSA